jgi:hypothetical protein
MKNKLFLTESERSRISDLHRMAIVTEGKNTLNEATLVDIQNLLIKKGMLGPKGADDKLGPLTLNAIYSGLTGAQGTGAQVPPTGTQGTGAQVPPTQGTGAQVPPTGTQGTGAQGTPIYYPWVKEGGKPVQNIIDSKKADPNFQTWLSGLKKLTTEQLTKIQEDLKAAFLESAIGVKLDSTEAYQPYMVALQTIRTAMEMVKKPMV